MFEERTPKGAWWALGLGVGLIVFAGGATGLMLLRDQIGGMVAHTVGVVFVGVAWLTVVLGAALGIVNGIEALRQPKAKRRVATIGLVLCAAIETVALGGVAFALGYL